MNLIEVYVDTYMGNNQLYYYGGILFDCGLKIQGIHFSIRKNSVYVYYPAIQDKKRVFHPSFRIMDILADNAVKNILKSALQLVKNGEKKVVYGYRKEECNKELCELLADDFEWIDEKRKNDYQFSSLWQFSIRVELLTDRKGTSKIKCAYGRVYFNELFVINNLKIFLDCEGNGTVRLPSRMQEESVIFVSEDERNSIETYIIDQFRNTINQSSYEREDTNDEERLFQILWNASDNGYILQSKIRGILEQNRIDWRNVYHVRKISELVEKMSFMSVRRLEPSPEHYANWVAISYERDPESIIITKENAQVLPEDVKKELHDVLADEYRRNGKIDLSRVIPYMMEEHPATLAKLPKSKLKTILQSCDFVQFEGGPMPPIYVHILDEALAPTWEEDDTNSLKADENKSVSVLKEDYFYIDTQLDTMSKAQIGILTESGELAIKGKDEYNQPAKNNPFAFVLNTKLISEQNIPDTALPKITANEASKKFLTMASYGHLDSMDLEIVYWVSNMQYAKSTFLYDLITSGFIAIPAGKNISRDKLSTRLMRLYKIGLIEFYKLCSVDEDGNIISKSAHRLLMITAYGRTQLRTIGRQSNFEIFMTLDNVEKILNKLSINQWFTKFIAVFGDVIYHFDAIVTAKIAEANAARISLIINMNGIPIFVSAYKRGMLHKQDIHSGEFAFWIKRVSNILKNYNELYVGDRQVEFSRRPKMIFVCEDSEHCVEIYRQLLDVTSKIGDRTVLDNLWFADDLDIYNDFLHAHFSFDGEGKCVPASIDEFLGVEISKIPEEKADFSNEQSTEEDMRILEELDYEEKQMMQSLVEE